MKKTTPLILFIFLLSNLSGQVLCIQCYQQNDSVYAGGVNLIQNGGFENTNCIPENWFQSSYCPNSSYYNCNITNWTCTGGGTNTYADIVDIAYSQIVQGSKAVYFGSSYATVCSVNAGDTSCLGSSACLVTGIPQGYPTNTSAYGGSVGLNLEQTVTGLTLGNTYILEFWAGGETGQSADGVFAVDVGFGNNFLRNKRTYPNSGIGTRYLVVFIATSTTHTIKFTNWGHVCSLCTELILDDVKLYVLNGASSQNPCGIVGVNNLEESIITIYPNPATDQLTVNSEQSTIKEIKIRNVLGEEVFQSTINSQQSTIDIKNYERGIYFVEIKSKEEVIRKKFIIVN